MLEAQTNKTDRSKRALVKWYDDYHLSLLLRVLIIEGPIQNSYGSSRHSFKTIVLKQ